MTREFNFSDKADENYKKRLSSMVNGKDRYDDSIFYIGLVSPLILAAIGAVQVALSYAEDKAYDKHKDRNNRYFDMAQTAFPLIMAAFIGFLKYRSEKLKPRIEGSIEIGVQQGFFKRVISGEESSYMHRLNDPRGQVDANTLYIYSREDNLYYTLLTPNGREVTETLRGIEYNPVVRSLSSGDISQADIELVRRHASRSGHTFPSQPETEDSLRVRLLA